MLMDLTVGLAVFAAILLLLAAVLPLWLGADRFRPRIERWVGDRYRRRVAFEGRLGLRLLPRIALTLPRTTLSEPGGASVAISIESARVVFGLLPLLRGRFRVDALRTEGLRATVERAGDGTTSIDDLLDTDRRARQDPASEPEATPASSARRPDPGAIDIVGAEVTWIDRASGACYRATSLDLHCGRRADGGGRPLRIGARFTATHPDASGELNLDGMLDADLGRKTFALGALTAAATATVGRRTHAVDLKADSLRIDEAAVDGRRISVVARIGGTDGRPDDGSATLEIDGVAGTTRSAAIDAVRLTMRFAQGPGHYFADVAGPATLDLERQALELSALAGEVGIDVPAMPARSLRIGLSGSLAFDLRNRRAQARLEGTFDETSVAARLDVAGFGPPGIVFDVEADRIDLDRYRTGLAAARASEAAAAAGGAAASEPVAEHPIGSAIERAAEPASEPGFEPASEPALEPAAPGRLALLGLHAEGRLDIGRLRAFGVDGGSVRVALKLADGRIEAAPFSAQLYGGTVEGSAAAQADGSGLRIDARFAGVSIGPLLRDTTGSELLEGRGDLQLALTTTDARIDPLRRALVGSGSLRVTDGAVSGIDLTQMLRDARRRLTDGDDASPTPADATRKTEFGTLAACFAVQDGIVVSDDLDGRSPLLAIRGGGSADILAGLIDCQLRVSVAGPGKARSEREGEGELEPLAGIELPVRLAGPLGAPAWQIDWSGVAQQALGSRIGERLLKRIAPQTERLREGQERLRERLKDRLRGLFQK